MSDKKDKFQICHECLKKLGHYRDNIHLMEFCSVCAPFIHKELKKMGGVNQIELAKAIERRTPQFISEVEKIGDDGKTI